MATRRRDADDFRREMAARRGPSNDPDMAAAKTARARANATVGGDSPPDRFHNAPENPGLYSQDDRVVLDNTRQCYVIIRKTFDTWVGIGRGLALIRSKADTLGKRDSFKRLLDREDLSYFASKAGKASCSRLLRIMENLSAVTAWHEGLEPKEKIEWASPASIVKRCPVFASQRVTRPPKSNATKEAAELRRANADLKARAEEVQQELSIEELAAMFAARVVDAEPTKLKAAVDTITAALKARGPVPVPVKRRASKKQKAFKEVEDGLSAVLGPFLK